MSHLWSIAAAVFLFVFCTAFGCCGGWDIIRPGNTPNDLAFYNCEYNGCSATCCDRSGCNHRLHLMEGSDERFWDGDKKEWMACRDGKLVPSDGPMHRDVYFR